MRQTRRPRRTGRPSQPAPESTTSPDRWTPTAALAAVAARSQRPAVPEPLAGPAPAPVSEAERRYGTPAIGPDAPAAAVSAPAAAVSAPAAAASASASALDVDPPPSPRPPASPRAPGWRWDAGPWPRPAPATGSGRRRRTGTNPWPDLHPAARRPPLPTESPGRSDGGPAPARPGPSPERGLDGEPPATAPVSGRSDAVPWSDPSAPSPEPARDRGAMSAWTDPAPAIAVGPRQARAATRRRGADGSWAGPPLADAVTASRQARETAMAAAVRGSRGAHAAPRRGRRARKAGQVVAVVLAVALAVLAIAVVVVAAVPAGAQVGGGCVIHPERGVVCGGEVTNPGAPGGPGAPGDPGGGGQPGDGGGGEPGPGLSGPSPTYWRARSILENAWGVCQTDDGRPGTPYVYELVERATGAILDTSGIVCVPLEGDPAVPPAPGATPGAQPVPPPPPAPPTVTEIWEATPLDPPVIEANPAARGLTGLTSWFWLDDPGVVQTDVDIEGWHVSGQARVDRWVWHVGDETYTTTTPGSEAAPAVEHMFERRGEVEVSVTRSWSGSYSVTGYGLTLTVGGLAAEDSSSVDYEVIEVRSVVDGDT